MFTQPLYRTLGIVGVGIVALIGVVSAQASRTMVPTGMDELLAEVRGLRIEINQAAATTSRMAANTSQPFALRRCLTLHG
jgi:hypothetical protein